MSREHQRARGEQFPVERMWKTAKKRADEQQQPFILTVADIAVVWPTDNICPVLGIAFARGKGFAHDASPTLDRLNHDTGYEPGNIAVISLRANRAKGGMSAGELEQIALWMRRNGLD